MGVWIMAGITFREAARKKISVDRAARRRRISFGVRHRSAISGRRFSQSAVPPFLRYQVISAMLMIGLYTVDLLAVVMTTLTSVDTISGEITSGTIHAIATKPLARWQISIGKWLGFVAMAGVYVAIMFGGAIAEGYWIGGVLAQHPVRGALLVFLECVVALVGHVHVRHVVFDADERRHHLGPAGSRVPGRVARTDERISEGSRLAMVGILTSLIMPSEASGAAPPLRWSRRSPAPCNFRPSRMFPFPARR